MRKFFTLFVALTLVWTAAAQSFSNTYSSIMAECKRGNADAFFAMGNAYRRGKDACPDFPHATNERAAYRYYLSAANKGHADAMFELGHMTFYGWGCEQDRAKAIEWYQKSAKAGNIAANGRLGDIYAYELHDEEGADKRAFSYYRKGAVEGDIGSMYGLGLHYLYSTKNTKDAKIWLARCAAWSDTYGSGKSITQTQRETMDVARKLLAERGIKSESDIYNLAEEWTTIDHQENDKYERELNRERAAAQNKQTMPSKQSATAGRLPTGVPIYMQTGSRHANTVVCKILLFHPPGNQSNQKTVLMFNDDYTKPYLLYHDDAEFFYFTSCHPMYYTQDYPTPSVKIRKDWKMVSWKALGVTVYYEKHITYEEWEQKRFKPNANPTPPPTVIKSGMSESYYRDMYNQYEMVAKSAYSSLSGSLWNSSASSSVDYTALRGELRKAQSDMRRVRQEAANAGYHIPQSMYETVTD